MKRLEEFTTEEWEEITFLMPYNPKPTVLAIPTDILNDPNPKHYFDELKTWIWEDLLEEGEYILEWVKEVQKYFGADLIQIHTDLDNMNFFPHYNMSLKLELIDRYEQYSKPLETLNDMLIMLTEKDDEETKGENNDLS